MQLLLDTHTFLWWVFDDPKLSATAKNVISDAHNTSYVSAASAWELAIKAGQGKLKLSSPVSEFLPRHLRINGFTLLDLKLEHLVSVEQLPAHHKDPFDRLLVVQAQTEKMHLVSGDVALDQYEIERLW